MIKISSIKNKAFSILIFTNYIGYYFALSLMFKGGVSDQSRFLTIPLRILIIFCLCVLLIRIKRNFRINFYCHLFIFYSLLYITRLLVHFSLGESYYLSTSELFFYFFSFAMFPFIITSSISFDYHYYDLMREMILFSALLFSGSIFFIYRDFVGQVSRLTALTTDESTLSPLALSYCGTLAIGVGISHLVENKLVRKERIYVIGVILISFVPFYLGASRGSLFALFLPFLLIFLVKKEVKSRLKMLSLFVLSVIIVIYSSTWFDSSLIDRFLDIRHDIQTGDSAAVRIVIWKNALNQFINHPLFGSGLKIDGWNGHPHNLFVEVLLTTGILGFVPFLIIIIGGFKKAILVFRYYPKYSWLGIVFVQSFMSNMFSGATYGASWLWLSLGLLFSFPLRFRQNIILNETKEIKYKNKKPHFVI